MAAPDAQVLLLADVPPVDGAVVAGDGEASPVGVPPRPRRGGGMDQSGAEFARADVAHLNDRLAVVPAADGEVLPVGGVGERPPGPIPRQRPFADDLAAL